MSHADRMLEFAILDANLQADRRDKLVREAEREIRSRLLVLDVNLRELAACKVNGISVDTRNFAALAVEIQTADLP
jgi:hypothetical protein